MSSLKNTALFVLGPARAKPKTTFEEYMRIEKEFSEPGLLNKDNTINWQCDCKIRDVSGPCGTLLRADMQCFYDHAYRPMHAQGAGLRSSPVDMERMSELYKEHCQAGAEQLALCKRARALYYGVEEAGFSDKRHFDELTYNKRSREIL